MITILKHGGHRVEAQPQAGEAARGAVAATPQEAAPTQDASRFDYMFPDLARDARSILPAESQTAAHLRALGQAMIDAPGNLDFPADDALIPAIYTYWGQFIDHDITANTDRNTDANDITREPLDPLNPDEVIATIKNLRHPAFDLDSLYDDGPSFDGGKTQAELFYEGIKFRLGKVNEEGIPGKRIPKIDDLDRDLPRIGMLIDAGLADESSFPSDLRDKSAFRRLPWIGDMRNDENTIVSQFHVAMLRFHNAVVDWVEANESRRSQRETFERARALTRWHYQWLVVNDFLKKLTYPGTVDEVIYGGRKFYDPKNTQGEFMPLEHSVAAYRFGHSMVRAKYDFNRNFGRGVDVPPLETSAEFTRLFQFTGVGGFLGTGEVLPFNWVIEFDRFIDVGSPFPDHFARKIDTRLAPPLADMTNQVVDAPADMEERIKEMLKHLAVRNLLRGYVLSLPTGQAIAQKMGLDALTEEELKKNNSDDLNKILGDGGFLQRTPLWYYVLKEAEVKAGGQTLGPVGSRIIAETFIGAMDKDTSSYRNVCWNPGKGVRSSNGQCITTIKDLITFAGLPA